MPHRSRAVGYPQIPASTSQTQLGLAPPQQTADHSRFSWQESSNEAIATDTEQQREVGDPRPSAVPPVPTLPEHLGAFQQLQHQELPPAQGGGQLQQQHQQTSQFHPDIPRHFQQYHQQQQQHHHQQQQQHQQQPQAVRYQLGVPSYEASQAAYRHGQLPNPRMQEQAIHPDHHEHPQPQVPDHPLAVPDTQNAVSDVHQSSEEKLERQERTQGQQLQKHIDVGPDANPLMPNSPVSVVSVGNTTNIQTFPPPATTFPQATSYGPAHSNLGGTWHHGLGSCAEPATCLSSLVCPCMTYGRTQYRLSMKSAKKDPTNMLGYSSINGSCLAWSVLCGVNILMTAVQHRRVRKAYEMDAQAGNAASDCLKSICCCCCIVAQDEKEMKLREERVQRRDVTIDQGYTSPTNMTFTSQR